MWQLPNLLTVSRILMLPFFVVLYEIGAPITHWIAAGLFIYACITDFFDGHIARVRKQESDLGRFLDPLADKLLIATALLMLVSHDRLQGIHLAPALIILWREILISGMREYLAGIHMKLPVSVIAKWKTALQMFSIAALLVADSLPQVPDLQPIALVCLWGASLLTIYTGVAYVAKTLRKISTDR